MSTGGETEPALHRLLIVEDEALIALDLERQLTRAGFQVAGVADDLAEAVKCFHACRPDLVLMDINLRGTADGIEVARALARLDDVPIVFLTAYADPATLARAAEVSPYGYLLKPFDERALAATITMALRRHAADTRLRVLEAAVAAALTGVLLVEVQGERRTISYVNDAFTALSGHAREQILGQRPCFLAADGATSGVARLRAALDDCTPAAEIIEGRRASGEPFWSSVVVSPVADRSGQIRHMLVFHGDITRARLAEQALAESQRIELLGRRTAGIAHDFGNILGAIAAFTELARADCRGGAQSDLEEVVQATARGARLIQQLVDFTRSPGTDPREGADLATVIAERRKTIEQLAGAGIAVDFRLNPESMRVRLDATALEQIVLTLVSSARAALPAGGRISLAVHHPAERSAGLQAGRFVRLEVSDSGPGMDPHHADRAFDAPHPTAPAEAGAQLGLYACRLLVERSGGTVRVRSAPGEGTVFTVDLPHLSDLLDEATPSVAAPPSTEPAVADAGGATCLLVDDDAPLRRAAARALKAAGFDVVEAASVGPARRALDALGDRVRLLVCEMVLGGESGADLLAHARRTAPKAALLAATGYFEDGIERLGPEVGILWKPYTSTALSRRALHALQASEASTPHGGTGPLPAIQSLAPRNTAPRPLAVTGALSDPGSPRVLIVEADATIRRGLRAVLEGRGLRVLEADSGAACLAILHAERVDLMVVDAHLPDQDGLELLMTIRASNALLPTLVMSSAPTVEIAQRALRGRVKALLTKPVAADEFIVEVDRAIEDAQVTRLHQKLLASRSGLIPADTDFASVEGRFAESLAGIHMVFQPIVRAHQRSIYAFEALMRSTGPYPHPGAILEAAEALGRVVELGQAVRESIARTLSERPERIEPVFVNLHPLEFRADLLTREDEPLLRFASRIVLEVTERAQLTAVDDLAGTVRALRKAGYRIALDDLGEGYAGLSWLVKVAPDIAKLDMSLVRDIDRSRIKRELVGSMVNVGRRAGTLIVAEGVETAAEAETLRDLGCDLLQGYHFARPGPPFPQLR